MAEPDGPERRRARPSRYPSGAPGNDWAATDDPIDMSSPRRMPHGDIDASEAGTIASAAVRHRRRRRCSPGPTAKVPTTPPRYTSSMSARKPSAVAAPGFSRAATVSSRWPGQYIYEEEDRSRSDSRRSDSRRDVSPHLYRSMAGSRRSSRTSLSESDADTDITISTQDEKHLHAKHVPPPAPPPPRAPKPPKSRKEVIYEEDAPVERRDRRPKLRREETLMHGEERMIPRSKSRRREQLIYPEEIERDVEEPRSKPRRDQVVYEADSDPEPLPKPRRGQVIYEEDCDLPSKYNPFLDGPRTPERGPSRAPSRAPSSFHEKHRGSGKDYRSRTVVDEPSSRSRSRHRTSKRLTGRYYETEVAYQDSRPTSARKARTTVGSNVTSSQSGHSSAPRRSSFLGNFFGPAIQPHHYDRPAKLVQCIICLDDEVPYHKTAKLKCGHRMCNSCLKDSFHLSVKDPQHMPPRCCTADHIPLKHVDRLFDASFKKKWNRKYAEFSTRNRIYCPVRRCGEWIKPENIHRDAGGRKYAKCGRCHTKVCYACNGKWHGNRDCPRDEDTHRFLEQAKNLGWQRCHRCKAVVELKEGCNHMTCRCGAEFCMICGSKWKSCDCPWFSHDAVESDRLEHMQIPMHIRSDPLTSMRSSDLLFDGPPPLSPRDFRPGTASPAAAARPRPQSYEEEVLLRRLREERLASRMRASGHYEEDYDDDEDDYQGRIGDIHGIGHSASHHMNDDYRRRPEALIVPPAPHTEPRGQQQHQQQPTYDRTTLSGGGADYVTGVHRARGVPRASSMERRLADRFNSDLRNGPARPPPHPPPPPMLKTAATMPIMSRPPMAMPPPPPPPQMMSMGGGGGGGGGHFVSSPGTTPVRRRHTMEEELYTTRSAPTQQTRHSSGRTRVHRRTDDFDEDDEDHAPLPPPFQTGHTSSRRSGRRDKASRQHRRGELEEEEEEDGLKGSRLAGLTGPGRGADRVYEWVNYVKDGPPEEHVTEAGGE